MDKVTFKELSLEDLKKDYNTRHGFVFRSSKRSSDVAIENLCKYPSPAAFID